SGEPVTDPAEIRKQTVSFYSKLYRSELAAVQEVEEDFLRNLPKITEESARELDRELTLEELEDCDTAAAGGTVRTGLCSLKRCSSTDGVKSVRVTAQLLQGWRSALTSEERLQLRDYCAGVVSPVEGEPSPVLVLVPNLSEVSGPLLGDGERTAVGLNTASGKSLYKLCVKVYNKRWLDGRVDTPWRSVLGLNDE
ncbi:hypothetical protein QTP70_018483, partial [Hemibagrus guttatus]